MEIKLIKKPSQIHGIGIFTEIDILEGETFYVVPLKDILHAPRPKCAHIGNNNWVSDEQVLNYVNHSCEPSALFQITGEPILVARRLIKAGEEITVDYNITEKEGYHAPCNCRSSNCRGFFLK